MFAEMGDTMQCIFVYNVLLILWSFRQLEYMFFPPRYVSTRNKQERSEEQMCHLVKVTNTFSVTDRQTDGQTSGQTM